MHPVAIQLDETLSRLDADAASSLEQTVLNVLDLAAKRSGSRQGAKDANGFPVGYFDDVIGSLEGQPFDYPDDLPPDPVVSW